VKAEAKTSPKAQVTVPEAGPSPLPLTPPAPQVPQPVPIPQVPKVPPVPLAARTVAPNTPVVHRHMLDSVMTVDEPALAGLSSVATSRFCSLSTESGLGAIRPPKARVGMDATNQFVYIAPTSKDDPNGIKVTYRKGRAEINLMPAFGPLSRYVQAGYREHYDVAVTPGKVQFDDGFEAVALYAYLVPTKTEPRRHMSEEAKAKRQATIARKKQDPSTHKIAAGQAPA
jgi:hypothetical protein